MISVAARAPSICLRAHDGTTARAAADWLGPTDAADEEVLRRALPPVLDIGCGPGRHVIALAERGLPSLGIDVTRPALAAARSRGAFVLERSVFDRVPGSGRWRSALLLDGNLGIGGDPVGLLRRVARLLQPGGLVLVELAPPGGRVFERTVRLELAGRGGPWFRLATVPADRTPDLATAAGLVVDDRWQSGTRWFARLVGCTS